MPTKMKDGRYKGYVVDGVTADGKQKRHYVYDTDEQRLIRKLGALQHQIDNGTFTSSKNMTFGAWAKQWRETYKSEKEMNTQEMYNILERHILPYFRFAKIKDIKQFHVQKFINELSNPKLQVGSHVRIINSKLPDGNIVPAAVMGKKYQIVKELSQEGIAVAGCKHKVPLDNIEVKKRTRTVKIALLTLNQIFKKAISPAKLILDNPCEGVELPSYVSRDTNKIKKRSLTKLEQKYCRESDLSLKDRTFIFLLLDTGIRKGEIFALRKNDIDFPNNTISINKVIVWKANDPLEKPYPKSVAGIRKLPILDELKPLLQEYVQEMDPFDYLFTNKAGGKMSNTSVRKYFASIIKKVDFAATKSKKVKVIGSDVTMHTFRHTYATMLYYAGVAAKEAQYLLGHETLQMTLELYTHLMNEEQIDIADKLNGFLSPKEHKEQQRI